MLWREVYPLHYACSKGRVKEVEDLLLTNIDVNARDWQLRAPLHEASSNGHVGIVRILLQAHAKVDVKDCFKKSPLHLAAIGLHRETFVALESAGVDLCMSMHLLLQRDSHLRHAKKTEEEEEEEEAAEEEAQEEGGGGGQARLVGQKAQIVCAGAVGGIVGGFGGISWGGCMGGFA